MEHGNPPSALIQRRYSHVRPSLVLALVLFLLTLVPSEGAFAQTGATIASTGHRLVGTVEGGAFSGAVLVDTSGEQKFYRLNDILPDGSRLFKLRSGSILIKQPDGEVLEVYVVHELRTAIPPSHDPTIAPKRSSSNDAPAPRHRSRRHLPPTLDEGADVE